MVSQVRMILIHESSVPEESVVIDGDGVDGAGGDRFAVGATGSGL